MSATAKPRTASARCFGSATPCECRSLENSDAPTTAVAPVTQGWEQAAVCGFEVAFLPADFRVSQMRRITAARLRHWDLTELTDDATLAVSELVTNAVRHGRGNPVGFRVTRFAGELLIEVIDGTSNPARLRSAAETDETGRGLSLVAAVAQDWGVSPDGATTWCALAIPGGGDDGHGDG